MRAVGDPRIGTWRRLGAITGTMGAAAGAAALARGRLSGPGAANARIKQLTERLAALDGQYSDAAQALDKAHQDREALEQERKVLGGIGWRVPVAADTPGRHNGPN